VPSLIVRRTGEVLVFDGIKEEMRSFPANVTDHPTEEPTVDNRQRLPQRLSLEGIVTATPLRYEEPEGPPNPNLGVLFPVDGEDRIRAALDFLRQNDQELWDYVSIRTGVVENLMIENMELESTNVREGVFELEMKEVLFGRSELVDLPPVRRPSQEPPVEEGDQEGKEVEEIKTRTVLHRLTGGADDSFRATVGEAVDRLPGLFGFGQ
jgi:hypothetical protein